MTKKPSVQSIKRQYTTPIRRVIRQPAEEEIIDALAGIEYFVSEAQRQAREQFEDELKRQYESEAVEALFNLANAEQRWF